MLRLLLIEDNEDDSLLIREMPESAKGDDFRIDWADRLSKGLARLQEAEFDAVLLDLSLPDSRGLDTLVKVQEHAARLPVIVLTGLNDENIAVEALQKGAQDYLVKGTFNDRVLAQAMRYAQVQDSGAGIPANEIANLFQKYRQVSSATVSAQKGTGLGLVICKMIVQAHGGNISVESKEGKGTIFTFTLPCAKGPESDAPNKGN